MWKFVLITAFILISCSHSYNRNNGRKFESYRRRILINSEILRRACPSNSNRDSLQKIIAEIQHDSLAQIVQLHNWNDWQEDSFLMQLSVLAKTASADSSIDAGMRKIVMDSLLLNADTAFR